MWMTYSQGIASIAFERVVVKEQLQEMDKLHSILQEMDKLHSIHN